VLAFFRVNPAKSFNQPDLFYPERLFLSIIGSMSGEPGKQEGGGAQKNQKFGEFSFRGIFGVNPAANDGQADMACPQRSFSARRTPLAFVTKALIAGVAC